MNYSKNRKKPHKMDYVTFIKYINEKRPYEIEFNKNEIVDNETIDCKEIIRNYKPKMTKMEFEVIHKMKKTDNTNQLQIIKDFKDRVIK